MSEGMSDERDVVSAEFLLVPLTKIEMQSGVHQFLGKPELELDRIVVLAHLERDRRIAQPVAFAHDELATLTCV